ncbi:MAG TPA: helix-turn-helix domain-containing protein [Acidimicrobiales bacterium]|nr:helix-turn-helix domain-containing protein [Acidimicrobiales bacterium]
MNPSKSPAAADRPIGRDEVRAAILEAASRRFAAQGPTASLRDIAADAQVNLGLVHRHFGNKDDLIRAVLERHARAGLAFVADAPDLPTATRRVNAQMCLGTNYLRIVAWLMLGDAPIEQFQDQYPTIRALREQADDADQEMRLLAAFAAIYGWAVFGPQLLAAFDHEPAERAAIETRIGDLLAQLVRG